MRRLLLGVLAALLVVAVLAALVLSRGTFDTYPRAGLAGAGAPAWTAPCRADPGAGRDRAMCRRVAGRVVWIQKRDPDGDGDRHLIVVARLRPRIVKVPRDFPLRRLPGRGSWVDATGWVVIGASGHSEVEPRLLRTSGEVARAPIRGR